ncbi:hypothetical protein DPV74_24360 [Burkholderia sp. HAN2018]|nr:hypothetical protein [Burkholderia sp. HAN2018]
MHASRSTSISASAPPPASPLCSPRGNHSPLPPSLIQIRPCRSPSKTGSPNKKPRQRGVFDVLRF